MSKVVSGPNACVPRSPRKFLRMRVDGGRMRVDFYQYLVTRNHPKVKVKEEQCKRLKLEPQSVETEEKRDEKVVTFINVL